MKLFLSLAVTALVLTGCAAPGQPEQAAEPKGRLAELVRADITEGEDGLLLRAPSARPDVLEVAHAVAAAQRHGVVLAEPSSEGYQRELRERFTSGAGLDLVQARAAAGLAPPPPEQWRALVRQTTSDSPLRQLRLARLAERVGMTAPALPAACAQPADEFEAVELASYVEPGAPGCAPDLESAGRLLDEVVRARSVDSSAVFALAAVAGCEPCGQQERVAQEAGRMADVLERAAQRGTAVDAALVARLLQAAEPDPARFPTSLELLRKVVAWEGRYPDGYEPEAAHQLQTLEVLRELPDPRFDAEAVLEQRAQDLEAAGDEGTLPRSAVLLLAAAGRTVEALPAAVVGDVLDVPGLLLRLNDPDCSAREVVAAGSGPELVRLLAQSLAVRLEQVCGRQQQADDLLRVIDTALDEAHDTYEVAMALRARCAVGAELPAGLRERLTERIDTYHDELERSPSPWEVYDHPLVWGALETRRLLSGACASDWWQVFD